jgi:hypothetical protein
MRAGVTPLPVPAPAARPRPQTLQPAYQFMAGDYFLVRLYRHYGSMRKARISRKRDEAAMLRRASDGQQQKIPSVK